MKGFHYLVLLLVIIGAINWGLVGLFEFDLVAALFGGVDSPISRFVYVLVGIAGVLVAITTAAIESRHNHADHDRTRVTAPRA